MESVIAYFSGLGLDFMGLLKFAGIFLLGSLLISFVSHFIFRKKTLFAQSVSSSIAIVFIYVAMVLILTLTESLQWLVTPLPFAEFSQGQIVFFSFEGARYTVVASQLLSMLILAFLVNLMDAWIPTGKNLLTWVFWRCVTVALGVLLHFAVTWLFNRFLPQGIVIYAPAILLAVLVLMLLTGALRFLVGVVLTTVNPIIAAFYMFFFANVVGKQITKAVLTTGILSGVIVLLQHFDIVSLSIMAAALTAYIPFLLLLLLVWYIVSRL